MGGSGSVAAKGGKKLSVPEARGTPILKVPPKAKRVSERERKRYKDRDHPWARTRNTHKHKLKPRRYLFSFDKGYIPGIG